MQVLAIISHTSIDRENTTAAQMLRIIKSTNCRNIQKKTLRQFMGLELLLSNDKFYRF